MRKRLWATHRVAAPRHRLPRPIAHRSASGQLYLGERLPGAFVWLTVKQFLALDPEENRARLPRLNA